MKNLYQIYKECCNELLSIGMDISKNITCCYPSRKLKTTLGICNYDKYRNTYEIEINMCLLSDNADVSALKDTIIHELIHTCPGCMNHGKEWKRRAEVVNWKLGYNISRCATTSEMKAANVVIDSEPYKFGIVCDNCGIVAKRKRDKNGGIINRINNYRCGKCKGSLHVVNLI